MSDFPLLSGGGPSESFGADLTTSFLTSVATGARTYGAYTELIAATAFSYESIVVFINQHDTSGVLFELAIGAGGSEVTIAGDIPAYGATSRRQTVMITLPLHVPAGARIAAHASRDAGTASTIRIGGIGLAGGPRGPVGFQRANGYGIVPAFTGIPSVAPHATVANSKGSWTQITSSALRDLKALIPLVYSASANTQGWLVDVGMGAGSAEVVVVPNVPQYSYVNTGQISTLAPLFPVDIPAGTRLAMRCQSDLTTGALLSGIVGLS